jgi:hypothetical protein
MRAFNISASTYLKFETSKRPSLSPVNFNLHNEVLTRIKIKPPHQQVLGDSGILAAF